MTIGKLRSVLYKSARVLGDVNAVRRGRVPQRLVRRAIGKVTGRGIGSIMRLIFGRRG